MRLSSTNSMDWWRLHFFTFTPTNLCQSMSSTLFLYLVSKCPRHVMWFGPIEEFPTNLEQPLLAESCLIGCPQVVWGNIFGFLKKENLLWTISTTWRLPGSIADTLNEQCHHEMVSGIWDWPFSSTNTETLTVQFKAFIAWKRPPDWGCTRPSYGFHSFRHRSNVSFPQQYMCNLDLHVRSFLRVLT